MDNNKIIGITVKYFDFLGSERFGKIVAVEPYPLDPEQLYVYIQDEEPEANIHTDVVNGLNISYAELRPSGEVIRDK